MTDERAAIRVTQVTTLRAGHDPDTGDFALPVEAPLAVEVNGTVVAHLMRLPGHDAELALGFCFGEGHITGLHDITSLEVCEEDTGIVRLRTTREVQTGPASVLISACAGGRVPDDADLPERLTVQGPPVDAQVLLGLVREMQEAQEVFAEARAVHGAAAFSTDGKLLVVREDVGRHNAVDKVVGYCLYHRGLSGGILVTTGRASSEMVIKAGTARFPIAVSRSGPTSLGVELAERLGITLVCYARGARMTVCTHPERIAEGGPR